MNNYILSFICLLFLIFYYLLVGCFVLTKIEINKNKYAVYLVTGWMITFVLGWIIGFPAQFASKSWYYFSSRYKLALIILGIVSLICNIINYKAELKSLIACIRSNPFILLRFIFLHIKKYWYIYLFVCIFTCFSVTNLQPYTLCNYTDDHYIVKMVHMSKAKVLLNEYYGTGELLKTYGNESFAIQQGHKLFNTYELIYTFFANMFSIDIVCFARFTMTLHNYLIWFLGIQCLGSIFLPAELSQYSITLYIMLLIPEGYAARGMPFIKIRIFENWRNQTAIYMGGSIVRNLAFPLLMYFSYIFYNNKNIIAFMFIPIVFLTLLSFQTTAISYLILFIPIFFVSLINFVIWSRFKLEKDNFSKLLILLSVTVVIFLIFSFILIYIDTFIDKYNFTLKNGITKIIPSSWSLGNVINKDSLLKIYKAYLPYYNNVFKLDTFAKFAPIIILLIFLLSKNLEQRIIVFIISLLYLIFKTNKLKLFLSLISIEFFGTARMLNSIILLIIFLLNILMIFGLEFILNLMKHKYMYKTITTVLSLCLSLSVVIGINENIRNILNYSSTADGIIKQGYSLRPLKENDRMLPQMFVDIGRYFDSKPGEKYAVYTMGNTISYNGLTYSNLNLLLSSKKIMFYNPYLHTANIARKYNDTKKIKEIQSISKAYWYMTDMLKGKLQIENYDLAEQSFKKGNLNYVFLTNDNYANLLEKKGWKIVVGGISKGYWLFKRS